MGLRDMQGRFLATAKILPLIAADAAVEIQENLRIFSTTRRGNVPLYSGPLRGNVDGTVPTTAVARGNVITITAVDWVLRKARASGQQAMWSAAIHRAAVRQLRAIR
jgi:hypothetical protein